MSKTLTPAKAREASRLVASLADVKAEAERLDERQTAIEQELIRLIGVGETVVVDEIQLTVVQAVEHRVDYETLLDVARPGFIRKVTRKVLDTQKFQLLRKAGEVPAEVMEIVQVITRAPHLRITPKANAVKPKS